MAAVQALLADEARRKPALMNLTRLDPKLLANPSLASAVASACESILAKPATKEDRALVLKLARLLRLASLEPAIAGWIKDGTPAAEVVQALSALREIGSNRIDLFASLLDHADEAVRSEAIAALASSPDLKCIDLLQARWSRLPGALRVIVANGLTSSKEKAAAFAKAAAGGAFSGLDAATFEKLQAVLGGNDPALKSLMEQTEGMFGRVIRLTGKDRCRSVQAHRSGRSVHGRDLDQIGSRHRQRRRTARDERRAGFQFPQSTPSRVRRSGPRKSHRRQPPRRSRTFGSTVR